MSPERTLADWAQEILHAGPICDECLGRAFGKLGTGLTNEQRGSALRTLATMRGVRGKRGACWICQDIFAQADALAGRAAELVRGVEFRTYLFGVVLTPRLSEAVDLFSERFPTGAIEPIKHAFNRAVGRAFDRRFEDITVDFVHPDVRFDIDLASGSMVRSIESIYLYGRYRKLSRGIPQTKWPCRRCRGRGCPACGGTGKQYPESVEEWIGAPFQRAAEAEDIHLHGAGREDIDARMLGRGRPFVLEIVSPRRRSLDVEALMSTANAEACGKVEIVSLETTVRATVALVKETKARKRYRASIRFEAAVSNATFEAALRELVGTIHQRTPERVAHRRSDLIRERRVYEAVGTATGGVVAEAEFLAEGGLYITELVSGDGGRTVPSLAAQLGVGAVVTELDVLDVSSSEFPDGQRDAMDIDQALP